MATAKDKKEAAEQLARALRDANQYHASVVPKLQALADALAANSLSNEIVKALGCLAVTSVCFDKKTGVYASGPRTGEYVEDKSARAKTEAPLFAGIQDLLTKSYAADGLKGAMNAMRKVVAVAEDSLWYQAGIDGHWAPDTPNDYLLATFIRAAEREVAQVKGREVVTQGVLQLAEILNGPKPAKAPAKKRAAKKEVA